MQACVNACGCAWGPVSVSPFANPINPDASLFPDPLNQSRPIYHSQKAQPQFAQERSCVAVNCGGSGMDSLLAECKSHPSRTQVAPKSHPSRTQVAPKSHPSRTQVAPKSHPSRTRAAPKPNPSRAQVAPKSHLHNSWDMPYK